MVRDTYSMQRDRRADPLESIWMDGLPEDAVPAFEAAFLTHCRSVALFKDDPTDSWRVEGVRPQGAADGEFAGALALASLMAGIEQPELQVAPVEAEGWLARTPSSFEEMPLGGDGRVRPPPVAPRPPHGRPVPTL